MVDAARLRIVDFTYACLVSTYEILQTSWATKYAAKITGYGGHTWRICKWMEKGGGDS